MKRITVATTLVFCMGWLLIATARSLVTPQGGEFQVNSSITGEQYFSQVAVGPDGEMIVVWQSAPTPNDPSNPFSDILARRFDSNGAPLGGDFVVNTYTTNQQARPDLAIDSAGNFVVVWRSRGSDGTDTSGRSVQARRFDSAGAPIGNQFQVNEYTTFHQDEPRVTFDGSDNFIVIWTSEGSQGDDLSNLSAQAQRFDSNGLPLGGEFQLNSYTTSAQWARDVTAASDGSFVAVWSGAGPGDASGIMARRFDSSATPVGAEFQVNTYTTSNQNNPSVALAPNGDFAVVWGGLGDGSYGSARGQRFESSGAPIGDEFQINTYTTLSQRSPRVGYDDNGNFVVVWNSYGSAGTDNDDSASVHGQVFDASGDPVGGEFQINTYTTDNQTWSSLAVSPNGDFVVTWQSWGSSGTDNSWHSVQAQRFSGPLTDPIELTVTGFFNDESMDGYGDPGETIDYTIEVTHPATGFAPLTNVHVTDSDLAPILCPSGNPIPVLDGGATEICTGTHVLTQADVDAGRKDTLTTVDSDEITPVSAAETVLLAQNPAIDLAKSGLLDLGGDGVATAGDLINYLFDVTNTGNVTLTDVTIDDPLIATLSCPGGHPVAGLTPGTAVTCTGSYAITQADIDAGVVNNTAAVTADEPGGGQVNAQDSHSEPIPRVPFACDGTVYIVHEVDAVLSQIDEGTSPFGFVDLAGPVGREINNLGFNTADGLLYGVELSSSGNVQLVQIDATGSVFGLGRPTGLPANFRFDGGDLSTDGSAMYIIANNSAVYRVAMPALTVTSVSKSGATGNVFDWAYNPADGRLYGGDSSHGQLASIDPATGVRTDVGLTGLPSGAAYGGAWFNAAGHLFLYRNNGEIYEIDVSAPMVVDVRTGGPASSRNDGASCIDTTPPATGLELFKSGALDLGGNDTTDPGDLINYTFEITNTGTDALTNVTLTDPLIASFTCPSSHPIPFLAGGASETCTASYSITQADVDARVRDNTATVTGTHGSGPVSDSDSHSEPIPAPPGAGPVPFACSGDAFIVQNQNAELTVIDQSVSPFVFVPVGSATGIEINNLGFRSTDGLLYAVELTSGGNVQVIQIDATGAVFGLGRPSGLPTGPRFDAGDVSPDGSTMYITSNNQDLYVLDLTGVPTLPAVTAVNVTGATGYVFDWAVSPVDGMLYGGDSTSGQLARIDPATGVRTDVGLAGLPSGAGYGGAWFDAAGTLFLYQNSGTLYEIDLNGPTVVNTQAGPGASRNDGAACINLAPPAAGISLTKTGVLDLGGNGTTDVGDVIDYTFEITNTGTDALTNVTLSDPLIASFTCPSGHPIPTLAGGASETCTATYAITQADIDTRVRDNTADVTGTHDSGPITDSDSHSESIPAPPGAGPVPFACTGDAYIVQNQDAQLTLVDQSVSPFVFVPIGGATGIEINNLGFRSTDGLLYAVELTSGGNVQILQIDATGAVFDLGRPSGLPSNIRFDAGDVSPDGSTMYITAVNRDLYIVDLTSVPTLPAVTMVDVTGANGYVFDWAVSPLDGMLYGGDSTSGQLARIDPATGVRTDFNVTGLPSGSGYGGAWFDTTGSLFLYRNSGAIYEIEVAGPSVVDVQSGPGATRNDGAACSAQP